MVVSPIVGDSQPDRTPSEGRRNPALHTLLQNGRSLGMDAFRPSLWNLRFSGFGALKSNRLRYIRQHRLDSGRCNPLGSGSVMEGTPIVALEPEERVLLHTARLQLGAQGSTKLERLLASELDWGRLVDKADWYETAALLLHHLEASGQVEVVPEPVLSRLKRYQAGAAGSVLLLSATRAATGARRDGFGGGGDHPLEGCLSDEHGLPGGELAAGG